MRAEARERAGHASGVRLGRVSTLISNNQALEAKVRILCEFC